MDPQILAAITGLAITVIGAIGTLVTVLIERVKRDLAANTAITKETRAGLRDTVEKLASARNIILGLREVVRERDDRIAFIVARHPEVEETIQQYRNRRTRRATELEEYQALQRFEEIDDPTGTDAGAHPAV